MKQLDDRRNDITTPPRPRRRTSADAQRALTRQRLVSAALSVFRHRGYAAATVDEIAELAETSRTTFYAHFKSKAVLMDSIMREGIPAAREHFASLDRLGVPSREQVTEWIEETVRYWEQNGPMIDVMHQAMAAEPSLASLMIQLVDESLEGMPNYLARKDDANGTARLRATALILQLEQFCFFWLVRGAPYDGATASRMLADIWFQEFASASA